MLTEVTYLKKTFHLLQTSMPEKQHFSFSFILTWCTKKLKQNEKLEVKIRHDIRHLK